MQNAHSSALLTMLQFWDACVKDRSTDRIPSSQFHVIHARMTEQSLEWKNELMELQKK
jgi:hypothetical protein